MLSSLEVNSDEARFCTAMGGDIALGSSGAQPRPGRAGEDKPRDSVIVKGRIRVTGERSIQFKRLPLDN
jgi:hypothetical protein